VRAHSRIFTLSSSRPAFRRPSLRMLSITELFRTPWGLGVRATRDIEAGEVVWIESPDVRESRLVVAREFPHLIDSEVVQARMKRYGFELDNGDLAVSSWLTPYILGEVDELPLDARPDNGEFFNHCCDPNCWWEDDYTLVARRKIAQGEELRYDYATEDAADAGFPCGCGAECCRGSVTALDYTLPELQARYGDHWKSHIVDMIRHHIAGSAPFGLPGSPRERDACEEAREAEQAVVETASGAASPVASVASVPISMSGASSPPVDLELEGVILTCS